MGYGYYGYCCAYICLWFIIFETLLDVFISSFPPSPSVFMFSSFQDISLLCKDAFQ